MFSAVARRLRLLAGLAAVCAAALPTVAWAGPFNNSDLLVGRTIKISSDDRTFTAGANFQIAPVNAIVHSVVKKAMDSATATNPDAVKLLQYANTPTVKAAINSNDPAKFKSAILAEMKAHGVTPSAAQQKSIDAVSSDASQLKQMSTIIDMINIANQPEQAMTFSLEPYASLNFKPVTVTARVALAGFHTSSAGTTMSMGNLGLDVKTGDAYGVSGAAFGWSLGSSFYAPTGTSDADTIALSNILAAPRYLHNFMTVSPYAVLGAELAIFKLTVRGEYVDMTPVRESTGLKRMAYFDMGAGLLADLGFLGLSLELDGLKSIENAPAMDNVWLATGGVRTYMGPVQLGVGLQVPLVSASANSGSMGGVNLGSPSKYNVLVNGQFKF